MPYIKKQNKVLKVGDTFFPKSYNVPCSFACAKIAKIGIIIAVDINPKTTIHQSNPALTPRLGGKIKFPAPKKSENNAKPAIQVSFFMFMVILI